MSEVEDTTKEMEDEVVQEQKNRTSRSINLQLVMSKRVPCSAAARGRVGNAR